MELTIELNDLKPLSFNQAWRPITMGKSTRMIKSKEYRDFEIAVHEQMWKKLIDIKRFASDINSGNHYLKAEYTFYIKGVITKKGVISKRCIDVSNAVKVVEDCVFNQLGIDDALVVHLSATKVESDNNRICIKLTGHDVGTIV